MTKNKEKKDITRETLRLHDIHYDEEVYRGRDELTLTQRPDAVILPDHVEAVREALLTFEGLVPHNWERHLLDEFVEHGSEGIGPSWNLQPPGSAIIPKKAYEFGLRSSDFSWAPAHNALKDDEKLAETARQMLADAESGWKLFWRSKLFRNFSDEACKQPGFSPMLDTWSLEEDMLWTEFPSLEPQLSQVKGRTQPKPDLTYSFPILSPAITSLRGFERDEFMQCFSLESLSRLNRNGVLCAPTTGLRRWSHSPEGTKLDTSDLSCFPWAVIEMKKQADVSEASVERCYCQAANAAAAALEFQAQLFEKDSDLRFSELPPVIAFTCIGPLVKVWLMYRTNPVLFIPMQRRMVCIWSTTVQLTWGVTALREIVAHMHIWASRLLKPKVQAWVFQASRHLPQSAPRNESVPKIHFDPPLFSSPEINTPTVVDFNNPITNKRDSPTAHNAPSTCLQRRSLARLRALKSRGKAFSRNPFNAPYAESSTSPSLTPHSDFSGAPSFRLFGHNYPLTSKKPDGISNTPKLTQSCKESKMNENTRDGRSDSGLFQGHKQISQSQNEPEKAKEHGVMSQSSPRSHSASSESSNYSTDSGSDQEGVGLGLESGEESDDSDFNPSDESEYESSQDDSESEADTMNAKPDIKVTKKDVKRWRAASLQTLSGKQIAGMPVLEKYFDRLSRMLQLQMVERALGDGSMKLSAHGDYEENNESDLVELIFYLNGFLGSGPYLSKEAFRSRNARPFIIIALASIYLKNSSVNSHLMWRCLRLTLSVRSGYHCVEILSPHLLHLTEDERDEWGKDEFLKLNEKDQDSAILR
ncbi:uncharacterized protein K460DRAFT_365983 [Cucurbitaria berberidis CBS 394.84]|uniref:Uncharacterized protein n=1 Tax=Cucurbitaria berberidis CBS 394.84 TaxID=1168544 RepID=A0A9P4GH08_9PLEO|nr:uncharacterized protein K460DRAFT_365983 [Cucurbitaria berberidis CBS 394.84]KAF1845079.1 hypothetical protein K460DRAFT_365983 [Cucurbitaria berberidis CBS 394.84]